MESLFSFPVGLLHPLKHAGLSRALQAAVSVDVASMLSDKPSALDEFALVTPAKIEVGSGFHECLNKERGILEPVVWCGG
ncbi:hypothetical protein BDD14_1825 [Edaphobacter modestus]|uniref:Uncharacterized protein n=1 Tax=Edaphobacter modestus TaxID=388466 RepID=A0A4Q7YRF6_9BACT|nr:hypothetical protein BDD14_1825 [Edaphobacter modestus]